MTTRIKLDSTSNKIDVYKNLPSTNPNKKYLITLEDLVIPAVCDSFVLDGTPLFEVRRRVVAGLDTQTLPIRMIFTPLRCRNVAELIWQMNEFFRKGFLENISVGLPYNAAQHQYPIPVDFAANAIDWYTGVKETAAGSRAQHAIAAVFRSDGRVGFYFTIAGLKLFFLDLTEEGRRVLGWSRRAVAADVALDFEADYITDADPLAAFELPLAGALDNVFAYMDGSVFSHQTYRHEVVLNSSIPLQRKLEFSNQSQKYSTQIASYHYKDDSMVVEYEQRDRYLIHKFQDRYHLENSLSTHNQFVLSHTDMQNFHIRLMSRNYRYDSITKQYVSEEAPYEFPEGSFWYMTLAITPL